MAGENWSVFGEAIRRFINKESQGVFGNGNMQRKPGESNEDYYNRLIYAAGSAADAFNSSVKDGNPMEQFKMGVILNTAKRIAPWALVGVAAIGIFKYVKNRKKKGSRKPKY